MARVTAALLLTAALLATDTAAEPARVRVLTMNAAALPLVHARVGERMDGIGAAIAADAYDVVGLQELWLDRHFTRLAKRAALPHAVRSRRFSGLAILSRWPVSGTEELAFSALRPSWLAVSNGEPAASKGALRAVVATPWGPLDVYSAHAIANYGRPDYEALRLTELFELAEFVLERSKGRAYVVLADLNAGHGKADYDVFAGLLGARDACRDGEKELCGDERRGGKRIDFVLYSGGPRPPARAVLADLSDHNGYAADLGTANLKPAAPPDPKRRKAALEALEARLSRMIERLNALALKRSWIPVYGSVAAARYARQAAILAGLRERAATARTRLK
jgi:endonuclease/exonuclease/phosphatase family metal-dependent hydrolase